MGHRLQLHEKLKELTDNVYFQPKDDTQMVYPAIVYKRDDARAIFADNILYMNRTRYQVTVIDRNPDSDIPGKVALLPMCSFERHYAANGHNHDVYNLYF